PMAAHIWSISERTPLRKTVGIPEGADRTANTLLPDGCAARPQPVCAPRSGCSAAGRPRTRAARRAPLGPARRPRPGRLAHAQRLPGELDAVRWDALLV